MKTELLHFNLPFSIAKPQWLELGLMLKISACLLSLSIIFLLGFYVFQVGDLLGKSFTIRNYEIEMHGYSNNNSLGVVSVGSLNALEQKISALNFISVDIVRYIPIDKNQLVSNIK